MILYRRHKKTCPSKGNPQSARCRCKIWAKGTIEGKRFQRSLKTGNFKRADEIIKELTEGAPEPKKTEKRTSVEFALDKYYAWSIERKLSENTLRKYRTLRKTISEFFKDRSLTFLIDITPQHVRDLLSERNLKSTITAGKELERIRTFFTFCANNDWIQKNPARAITPPKRKEAPRIPFTNEEIKKIISFAEDDRERAFILTLRYSGLRVGDASLLTTEQLRDTRLFLRTAKSGTTVSVILPQHVVELLTAIPRKGPYFFLIGESAHPHSASNNWRRRIKRMCQSAGISPDHPHRFRHSLAMDLLSKGATIEDVASVLGNSPAIVAKHYSQWMAERQDRLDHFLKKVWAPAIVKKERAA